MEIVWSTLAIEHLINILDYVDEHFGTLISQKTHQKILSKIDRLVDSPQMGILNNDFSLLAAGVEVRHLLIAPNVIYYIIDCDKIVISAVLHSHQSPDSVREVISQFLKEYK